jgi:hypothetical protein
MAITLSNSIRVNPFSFLILIVFFLIIRTKVYVGFEPNFRGARGMPTLDDANLDALPQEISEVLPRRKGEEGGGETV